MSIQQVSNPKTCSLQTNSGLRAQTDPRVAELENRGIALPNIDDVKPASHLAELRSVGAMIGLRTAATTGFQNASAGWIGNFMGEGLLFHEVMTNTFILSLGYRSGGGISWEVTPVGPLGEESSFFSLGPMDLALGDARVRLQFFSPTSLWTPSQPSVEEEYAGVPTAICYLVPSNDFWMMLILITFSTLETCYQSVVGWRWLVNLQTGAFRFPTICFPRLPVGDT